MNDKRRLLARVLAGIVATVAVAALIIYAGQALRPTDGRPSARGVATEKKPAPELRDQAAIDHLKQTGCYDSLASAVTAARYWIETRNRGGWRANNPQHRYRAVFTTTRLVPNVIRHVRESEENLQRFADECSG